MQAPIETIGLGFVNCYLVKTDNGFILVDTGVPGKRGHLMKSLSSAGCKPGNLKLIVLTHGDIDHSGNCAFLRETFKVRIAMNERDARMVENAEMTPKREVRSALMRMMHIFMRMSGGFKKMIESFEKFKPDLYLEDGQSLKQYGLDATVLHLPGHSEGSIGILTDAGDLICGDILQNQGRPNVTLIVGNQAELASSVNRLSTLKIKTVLPGHGKPFEWASFVQNHK